MLLKSRSIKIIGISLLALSPPLAAVPPRPEASRPPEGRVSCPDPQDPRSLWECWSGGQGSPGGALAGTCVPKSACPPRDQLGRPVLDCTYENSWRTGFRCLLFCNYGGAAPWGSDGDLCWQVLPRTPSGAWVILPGAPDPDPGRPPGAGTPPRAIALDLMDGQGEAPRELQGLSLPLGFDPRGRLTGLAEVLAQFEREARTAGP